MQKHPSIPPLHPGALLREDILPSIDIPKDRIAGALGLSLQTLHDIVNERQPVSAEMAVRFGKLFGNGARFWIDLQRSYDLALAEQAVDTSAIPTLASDAAS